MKIKKQGGYTYPIIDGKRICSKCGVNLDISCFSNDKTKAFGKRPNCKKCHSQASNNRYWNDNFREEKARLIKEKRKTDIKWVSNEREKRKNWYIKNPHKIKEMNLKSSFGITISMYDNLLSNQKYKCAICETDIANTKFHVDHNHSTGEIRGILCSNCNVGFGHFREDINILLNAIKYVNNYPQKNKEKIYAKGKNNIKTGT